MTNGYANDLWDFQVFHKVSGVRKHYTHDDLFEPRRKMMEAWGNFCNPRGEPQDKKVVQLRTR